MRGELMQISLSDYEFQSTTQAFGPVQFLI